MADGSFLTFGGFVNGSRVSEMFKFNLTGTNFTGECIDNASVKKPCERASLSLVANSNKVYAFGG